MRVSAYLRRSAARRRPRRSAAGDAARALTAATSTNTTLTGTPALTRTEAVNFDWGTDAPGTGVGADNFSVRWTGEVKTPTTGSYRFRTVSDDGVRLWVNGVQVINNWTLHSATTNTSSTINLAANTRYAIRMEYYEANR